MRKWALIARKELATYFASPMAFIFLAVFLMVTLFVFFWVETFFARNIADVRPLFSWIPVLMIFLTGALTMRMWSEERRMGTIEFLFTVPVKTYHLVLGKFLACLALVGIALLLTAGVPLTVSFLGDFDLGPAVGAYLASLLLASSYIAIGLFVSSRTDNQIVSLIVTVFICSVFYLIGSDAFSGFFGNKPAEILKLIGTGSRFESVERGVIDLKDIYYYVSLTGIFLTLNMFSLEKAKWSAHSRFPSHKRLKVTTALMIANFLMANFWLHQVHAARVDLTGQNLYSVSPATKNMIGQLQEPLLIRGYFSDKTHPLLAPLVPQIRDMIREYAMVSHGRVKAEFVDPRTNEELEVQANRKYGIKPIPFQFADRYQAELVNSYFNILVEYGDKYEVLGFKDLIEVKRKGEMDLDVKLRNLEYDLTRSIKKVLYGFQGVDHLFATVKEPIAFVGFVSERNLPPQLAGLKRDLTGLLAELKQTAGDKFVFEFKDPSGDKALADEIAQKYGFQPMALSLLDQDRFYFYMLLRSGDSVIPIPMPEDLEKETLRKGLNAALQRMAPGFLKTVGFVAPPPPMPENPMMPQMEPQQGFQLLQEKLEENYTVKTVDLKDGRVGEDVDILLIVAPKELGKKELFAVDQFLMQGGTVVLATAPYGVTVSQFGLTAARQKSGLEAWLAKHGLTIKDEMVLDPQNANFPVAVTRDLGGFQVQEIKMVNYPYAIDIRGNGMNHELSLTSGIPQLTMDWASPIEIDPAKQEGRKVAPLLQSSKASVVSSTPVLEPDFQAHREAGFALSGEKKQHTLAVVAEGKFESFFKGEPSPLLEKDSDEAYQAEESKNLITGIIEKSPESARIILFASNEFVADQTLQISRTSGSNRFLNNLQIVENALDWSVEDRGLLAIRSRGQFARTMIPMEKDTRMMFEYLNYFLVLLGLGLIYLAHRYWQRKALARLAGVAS